MALELNREYPASDEAAESERLLDITMRTLESRYLGGPQQRDTHAKGLAVVHAEFIVPEGLPGHLRVGLFANPSTYPATIRFSNTDPIRHHDRVPDMRAMSIKLRGVPGARIWGGDDQGSLDLLLMTAKAFMTPTLAMFARLQDCLRQTTISPFRGNLRLVVFFLSNPRTALRVVRSQIVCGNLLEVPYFSETAYLFGERAMQFRAVPRKAATSQVPGPESSPNYLNERLRDDLAGNDAWFDVFVQFQVDPVRMPIEDSSVEWSDAVSPPERVAMLRLPAQDVAPPGPATTGEVLNFHPWRTLPEHKPLGWVNRVRLKMYQEIARYRANRNGLRLQGEAKNGDDQTLTGGV